MQLVLVIPDFVLAGEPGLLRACPVRMSADQCGRISAAVERGHVQTEAATLQHFHICAGKDPSRRGLEAIPQAVAVGFINARRLGEARLGVYAPTSNGRGGNNDRTDTIVFTSRAYQGAVAGNELREAFFIIRSLLGLLISQESAISLSTVFSSTSALPPGLNPKGCHRELGLRSRARVRNRVTRFMMPRVLLSIFSVPAC